MYFPVYWCSVPCKTRKLVSKIMHDIFLEYCTRKVIQWDNGGEFKGPFESLLLKHRIKENNKPSISSGVAEQMREVAQYIEKETWIPEKFEKGSNWVLDLQKVVHSINAFPMEVLRLKSFLGDNMKNTHHSLTFPKWNNGIESQQLDVCKEWINASRPSTYKIGEKVFIRFPSCKSRIPRRRYILQGTVLERRLKTHKYLIQSHDPINESFKTEWIGVENVTSETLHKGKQRIIKRIRTEHTRKYLIPLLHRDRLKSLDVLNNGSVKILLDPKGDRNCQFKAIVD